MNNKQIITLGLVLLLLVSLGISSAFNQKSPKLDSASSEPGLEETVKASTSPDNQFTAFIIGDKDQNLFVGTGKDFSQAKVVNTGLKSFTNLGWAPDSEFLFVGSTANNRGVILDPEDLTVRFSVVGYMSGPYWEPAGDKVCFTVKNSIVKDSGLAEETTDILVIDLHKKLGGVRFARGNLDYYYQVDSWEPDGRIKYSKVSSRGNRIIEKLSSEFGHSLFSIDLKSQAYTKLAMIKELEYLYFNPSPDRKWLSMVKLTFEGGETENGVPFFYNLASGQMIDLKEERGYSSGTWDAQWFPDSVRILFNDQIIYNLETGEKMTIELPENVIVLGGKPSPDGNSLAVLACKKIPETGSKGEPLSIYLLDSKTGKIVSTIVTSLTPFWENNHQNPLRPEFAWLDQQNLIVESWAQEEQVHSSLWKVNISENGSIKKFADTGQNPILSPDGQKVAYLLYNNSVKGDERNMGLSIRSPKGTVVTGLDLKEKGFVSFGSQIFWDSTSDGLLFEAYRYEEGVRQKYLVYWDLKTRELQKIKVEQSSQPLYSQDGKILCVDGSIH